MANAPLHHGGRLDQASAAFGEPPEGWLDLSTGINPFAYDALTIHPDLIRRLPHDGDLGGLLLAARSAYGLDPATAVAAAPGTQAIIQILPHLREPSAVAVLGPTYEEHAACWRHAGHSVSEADSLPDALAADVVVAVNPNNPDGRLIPASALAEAADELFRGGGLLIADEAFADVAPDFSTAPLLPLPGLVVLRSLGKFFGLAGLRLGFAAGEPEIISAIRERLGPWAVSGPAIAIGHRALSDRRWQEDMRQTLGGARRQLDRLLAGNNLTVIGGTDLFRLVEADDAGRIYEHLARNGILTRYFQSHSRWLRIGLPGSDGNQARLAEALNGLCAET